MAAKLPGIILMIAAIAAALSGEPATRTEQGIVAMAVCFILGVIMLADASAKSKRQKTAAAQSPSASPPTPSMPQAAPPAARAVPTATPTQQKCPRCGKDIAEDFVACPHCGLELKVKCPQCGRWLDREYVACPYCGAALKHSPQE